MPDQYHRGTCRPNCEPVNYPPPTVFNGGLVGCSPPSGFCFPIGVSAVTCFATNQCGSNTCSFTITVRPVPPPTLQCATTPFIVTAPCGSNCVPVFYPVPVVNNGTLAACTPAPGSCLPVGVHPVTCTATNRCGQSVSCTFNVEVRPSQGQPPIIQCPTNRVIRVPCNTNCVPISYPLPTVNNGVLVGCTPPPGTCLPVGNYVVHCTATNNCSSSSCEFTIQVIPDSVPPTIQCSSNILVTAPCGSNCVRYFIPRPLWVAACSRAAILPPALASRLGSPP